MCCFSNAPAFERVSDTRIFARFTRPHRQVLAYSMTVRARDALAMILPIPVPPGSFEDAVRFISLEDYADLFTDLSHGFPLPRPRSRGLKVPDQQALVVHRVGAFEASFVPSIADFSRLDPRFTVDTAAWEALPKYADYGFAVFKLRDFAPARQGLLRRMLGRDSAAEKTIHPMAFSFPTRDRDRLFFPTVHIHDGQVHPTAAFDHALYCQVEDRDEVPGWRTSAHPASRFVDVSRTKGLIDGARACLRTTLRGEQPNQDTWLPRWAS